MRAGTHCKSSQKPPSPSEHRDHVEPWLAALLQAEHLNLLVGSGLTTAIGELLPDKPPNAMKSVTLKGKFAYAVEAAANKAAEDSSRDDCNIEDQIWAINQLIGGLQILEVAATPGRRGRLLPKSAKRHLGGCKDELNGVLSSLITKVLRAEGLIRKAMEGKAGGYEPRRLLGGFLLPFASRPATRDRLHIFTTNYDRLIEYGCDLLGLRVLDRFVGRLAPVFRASRLGIDLHYHPPGIKEEPHYLEGVVRLTKLHGSLDWRYRLGPSGNYEVQRCALPFGADNKHSEVRKSSGDSLLIYPNPAKDVETLNYPYAELFRDFAAAVCRPNAVLVTYGYGFGDDHINRILSDMLSISSTHMVIISHGHADGRVRRFYDGTSRREQMTLLIGPHFGDLATLVDNYLPRPAIEDAIRQMADIQKHRTGPDGGGQQSKSGGAHLEPGSQE